jgi:WD40 repeat protein
MQQDRFRTGGSQRICGRDSGPHARPCERPGCGGATCNVVAGRHDGRVLVFTLDLVTLKPQPRAVLLCGHTQAVTSLRFTPDAQWLCSTGWDGTVRMWNTHGTTPASWTLAWVAPQGRLTLDTTGSRFDVGTPVSCTVHTGCGSGPWCQRCPLHGVTCDPLRLLHGLCCAFG